MKKRKKLLLYLPHPNTSRNVENLYLLEKELSASNICECANGTLSYDDSNEAKIELILNKYFPELKL